MMVIIIKYMTITMIMMVIIIISLFHLKENMGAAHG